jgi:hypothetical protein
MKSETKRWTKTELQVYILLLCANADSIETEEELNLIKSKVAADIYENIYNEFSGDSEEERIEKIDCSIQHHEFSNQELAHLRREMYEIFFSDCDFKLMERNLDRIMDNIIY